MQALQVVKLSKGGDVITVVLGSDHEKVWRSRGYVDQDGVSTLPIAPLEPVFPASSSGLLVIPVSAAPVVAPVLVIDPTYPSSLPPDNLAVQGIELEDVAPALSAASVEPVSSVDPVVSVTPAATTALVEPDVSAEMDDLGIVIPVLTSSDAPLRSEIVPGVPMPEPVVGVVADVDPSSVLPPQSVGSLAPPKPQKKKKKSSV
jgi:hypothetical protein